MLFFHVFFRTESVCFCLPHPLVVLCYCRATGNFLWREAALCCPAGGCSFGPGRQLAACCRNRCRRWRPRRSRGGSARSFANADPVHRAVCCRRASAADRLLQPAFVRQAGFPPCQELFVPVLQFGLVSFLLFALLLLRCVPCIVPFLPDLAFALRLPLPLPRFSCSLLLLLGLLCSRSVGCLLLFGHLFAGDVFVGLLPFNLSRCLTFLLKAFDVKVNPFVVLRPILICHHGLLADAAVAPGLHLRVGLPGCRRRCRRSACCRRCCCHPGCRFAGASACGAHFAPPSSRSPRHWLFCRCPANLRHHLLVPRSPKLAARPVENRVAKLVLQDCFFEKL